VAGVHTLRASASRWVFRLNPRNDVNASLLQSDAVPDAGDIGFVGNLSDLWLLTAEPDPMAQRRAISTGAINTTLTLQRCNAAKSSDLAALRLRRLGPRNIGRLVWLVWLVCGGLCFDPRPRLALALDREVAHLHRAQVICDLDVSLEPA